MLKPEEIRALALKKYPAFLRSIVEANSFFPLPIRFGKPTTSDSFAQLQKEIETLARGASGYRIEWREVRSPRLGLGRQKLPEKVWFENESEYLSATGKAQEVARFREQLTVTRQQCPEVIAWIQQRPLAAIEQHTDWPAILQVCTWLRQNPRPGCYAREAPLAISTKFIDEHQPILREILPLVLAPAAMDPEANDFAARFGFRREEPLIRLRSLDPAAGPRDWPSAVTDFSIPQNEFIQLKWPAPRVLVVENKYTFLSLPQLRGMLAIWGAGGAVELLTNADWVATREVLYWGDLDVMGFHLLNRLRRKFPLVRSIMMDQETLALHEQWAVPCRAPAIEEVDRLTDDERGVCADLRRRCLRLEQEKLPFRYAVDVLRRSAP
jgi:hypothetical protein